MGSRLMRWIWWRRSKCWRPLRSSCSSQQSRTARAELRPAQWRCEHRAKRTLQMFSPRKCPLERYSRSIGPTISYFNSTIQPNQPEHGRIRQENHRQIQEGGRDVLPQQLQPPYHMARCNPRINLQASLQSARQDRHEPLAPKY